MDDHDNNNNNHREEEGCYHYHQTIIRIFYQNLDVFCYFEMMLIPIEKKGCIVMSNYKTFQRIWNLLLCPEILIVSFCNHLFDPRVLFFNDMMGSHHCSLIIRHKKLLGYGFLWQARVDKLMSQAVDVDYETWYNNKVHNYA